jgi:lipooligosaccharide transport system permease protein
LAAIGYGLGTMIHEVDGRSYVEFFYPGLMVASGMMVAFFEGTYGSYTKLTRQKTFQTMLLAPLMPNDIVLGEILWATFKGWLSSVAVLLISSVLGFVGVSALLELLVFCALNAFVFAGFGFLMASYARNYDWFIYAQTGVIMPMYLFSGTYFPLSNIPPSALWIAEIFPLTHSVRIARLLAYGDYDAQIWISLAVLLIFAFIFLNWAGARIRRKLTQ